MQIFTHYPVFSNYRSKTASGTYTVNEYANIKFIAIMNIEFEINLDSE